MLTLIKVRTAFQTKSKNIYIRGLIFILTRAIWGKTILTNKNFRVKLPGFPIQIYLTFTFVYRIISRSYVYYSCILLIKIIKTCLQPINTLKNIFFDFIELIMIRILNKFTQVMIKSSIIFGYLQNSVPNFQKVFFGLKNLIIIIFFLKFVSEAVLRN